MDWKYGLTQGQVCESLMENGSALTLLEKLMDYSTKEDHLTAIGRNVS